MSHKSRKKKKLKRSKKYQEWVKNEYVGGIVYDKPNWHLKNDPLFREKSEPKYKNASTKVLSAKNEFVSGTAFYELKDGIWRIVQVSPELSFLKNKNPAEAKYELLQRGFAYSWA